MSEKKILVIDDSATIRRLVDTELGAAGGFHVAMAPNAEDGIELAQEFLPDLILLDHQLPGTTGYEVCCQLIEIASLKHTPVVISSTLRKKAYAEYVELSNVVDMLPKPYTADLLKTTVNNALETAKMVVHSQSEGSAVPEVIDALADGDLAGAFSSFSIREILDFLNNGSKKGCLEIECERARVSIYVDQGRIQAVAATGVDQEMVSNRLPQALKDLAPMVKFTIGGRKCSELDGLVELLDNKVLDARLLRQLLRHQAAILMQLCFDSNLKTFRFESDRVAPSLFSKLRLETSLLALMVEASSLPDAELPERSDAIQVVRNNLRGQNLDRAGLSSQHMKVLNLVARPVSFEDLCRQTGMSREEMCGVIRGFELAELVRCEEKGNERHVVVLSEENERAQCVTEFFDASGGTWNGKTVRDLLAVKLLMRRGRPDYLVVDLDREDAERICESLQGDLKKVLADVQTTGMTDDPAKMERFESAVGQIREWPESAEGWNNVFECKAQEESSTMVDCV